MVVVLLMVFCGSSVQKCLQWTVRTHVLPTLWIRTSSVIITVALNRRRRLHCRGQLL